MARPVLTGRHANIAIVAWVMPRDAITGVLPDGVEPDTCPEQLAGPLGVSPADSAVVSLCGLSGTDTRLYSLGVPGQSAFDEIALRIHARLKEKRGYFHVKRYLSRRMVTWAGTKFFGEKCEQQDVFADVKQSARTIEATYSIDYKPPMLIPGPGQVARPAGEAGEWSFTVSAGKPWVRPENAGLDNWLKEARWMFTKALEQRPRTSANGQAAAPTPHGEDDESIGGPMIHEILHPVWSIYPVNEVRVSMDMGNLFGSQWAALSQEKPAAGVLAVGSDVALFARRPVAQVRWGQRREGSATDAAARRSLAGGMGARR